MTNYQVCYYRELENQRASRDPKLTLDLVDIAHAAVSETLQTGGPRSAFYNQLRAFLTGKQDLIWKGDGPGIGRELRRSYSNIHGRFFARAYLEKCEGVSNLIPIEGNHFRFADYVVRLRDGQKGDMPDWVGWDSSGLVVAEAKGTYAEGNWWNAFYGGNSLPQCLRTAKEQVKRVQIDNKNGIASDFEFMGWSVASRWATETRWATKKKSFEPWLAAIGQGLGTQPPTGTGDARDNIILALQRAAFSRIVYGLGYLDENTIGEIGSSAADPPTDFDARRDAWRRVNIEEAPPIKGLSAVLFDGAFIPVESNNELDFFRDRDIKNDQVWLVTVLAEALDATECDRVLEERETSQSLDHLSRNGLAIANVKKARFANKE